jgi:uncharacterized protein (TIGR02265 family)
MAGEAHLSRGGVGKSKHPDKPLRLVVDRKGVAAKRSSRGQPRLNSPIVYVGGSMEEIQFEKLVAQHPSLRAELVEFHEQIARTPAENEVNGMYVVGLLELLRKRKVVVPTVRPAQRFRFYPLREYMELLVFAAVNLHPEKTVGEGLRHMGLGVIPTFASSLAGNVILSAATWSWEAALGGLTRGYSLSVRPGSVRVVESRRGFARVEFRGMWNFGETYQVGLIEGLMRWCKVDGKLWARKLSRANTDILIEWHDN